MVKCDECKHCAESPVNITQDPSTNEVVVRWGKYCNWYEEEHEDSYSRINCPHYTPYTKEDYYTLISFIKETIRSYIEEEED